MLILSTDFIKMSFMADIPCVYQIWNGYISSYDFRKVTNLVIDFLEKNNKVFPNIQFLVDTRQLSGIAAEDMEWAAKKADPKLYNAGMRKIAFLVPKEIMGKITINTYQINAEETTDNTMLSKQFSDIDSAKEWLKDNLN